MRKTSTARENRWPVKRYFADSTSTTRCPAAWKERASWSALVILPPLISTVRGARSRACRTGGVSARRSSAAPVTAEVERGREQQQVQRAERAHGVAHAAYAVG